MLRAAVVESNGETVSAVGRIVVVSDEQSRVPIALIHSVNGIIEFLTHEDGTKFENALRAYTFDSQRGYEKPNKVVKK